MRGNRRLVLRSCCYGGSIPACAGEPKTDCFDSRVGKVYPRVCGGTDLDNIYEGDYTGLSPRVRGNRGVNGHA